MTLFQKKNWLQFLLWELNAGSIHSRAAAASRNIFRGRIACFPTKFVALCVSSWCRISASHTQDSFKRHSWQLHLTPNSNDWERFWLGLAYLMPLFVSDIPLELPFRSLLAPDCSPPSRKFRLVNRAKASFVFEQHFKLFAKCVILPFCMHEQSFFVAFSSHFSQLWARLGVQYVAKGR